MSLLERSTLHLKNNLEKTLIPENPVQNIVSCTQSGSTIIIACTRSTRSEVCSLHWFGIL